MISMGKVLITEKGQNPLAFGTLSLEVAEDPRQGRFIRIQRGAEQMCFTDEEMKQIGQAAATLLSQVTLRGEEPTGE